MDGGRPSAAPEGRLGSARAAPARRRLAAWLAMLAVVVLVGTYAVRQPAGNADLVEYVATVHQWRGLSGSALREATYGDLAAFLTPAQYADVTGAAGDPSQQRNAYLRTLAADPVALTEQIPFYSVKPLYPGLMLVLGSLGVPLGLASVLISGTVYALLGLLLFRWARRHLGPWRAWLAVTLLILSPPFWRLAQLSSPDALALLIIAGGFYLLVEHRRPGLAIVILLVAILARPNAALLAIAVTGTAAVAGVDSGLRIRPLAALAGVAAAVCLVLGLQAWSGNYGIATLYYHAVVAYLPYPTHGAPPVPLADVVREYAFRTIRLATSPVPLYTLAGILALYLRLDRLSALRHDARALLVVAAMVAMVPGWLSYPNEPERILVGSFLAMAMVLVTAVGSAINGRHPAPPSAVPSEVPARALLP